MNPLKKALPLFALTAFAALILIAIACNKSSTTGNTSTNTNNIPPDVTVTATLQGRVVDNNGAPVQGATITSGSTTATTDVNGFFSFRNIQLSSRFGYVKAAKSGYFVGSRSIITSAGVPNYVSIQLIPRSETGSFSATAGGNIAVQSGDSASFTANSIVTASTNTAYTGTVHVFAKYLDPTDSMLFKYMPGDLRGIGTDGNETMLQSYGMLLVELQDDAGNKLQIATGQKAKLTWAIPSALQSTAPATIPLWYFNDSTGRWIEQGSATRQGNNYVGTVTHFSYWNCDVMVPTVNFKAHLKDQLGNPLAYTMVELQSQNYGVRFGWTDSTGFTQGMIPKSQSYVLQAMTPCGSMVGGINIGPALADVDLGTVTINYTTSTLTIKGTVVDCSNNPVDSGFVMANVDGLSYGAVVKNGSFTLPMTRCYSTDASVTLTAGDFTTSQVGSPTSITADNGTMDAGQLSACGISYTQYINFSWNGFSNSFTTPPNTIGAFAYEGILPGVSANSGGGTNLTLAFTSLSGTGSTNLAAFQYYVNGYMKINGNNGVANVTEYDTYAAGTFSGNMYDSLTKQTYPLTGTFKFQVKP
jgi:hypothetical protein